MGYSLDPTTGKPTFNNGPSTTSDFQAVADYTDRNTVQWVATVVDLEMVEYPREGEVRRVRADGSYHGYNGSGWEQIAGTSHQQLDTTNSTAFLTTQYGMGRIASVAAASITENVTFPVAFAGVPFIHVDYIGVRTTSAWNPAGLVDLAPEVVGKGFGPSTTGLTVLIHRTNGANLAAGWDFYYSWSATGVLA